MPPLSCVGVVPTLSLVFVCCVVLQRLALERNDFHRWTTAYKDANKTKNRFFNVFPCELTLATPYHTSCLTCHSVDCCGWVQMTTVVWY